MFRAWCAACNAHVAAVDSVNNVVFYVGDAAGDVIWYDACHRSWRAGIMAYSNMAAAGRLNCGRCSTMQ